MNNPMMSSFFRPKVITDLKLYEPSSGRCNLLLFGTSGVGKSSVINTLKSIFNIVKEGQGGGAKVRLSEHGQCTLEFGMFSFSQWVKVFDTWGWNGAAAEQSGNYSLEELKLFLEGKVDNKHKMGRKISSGSHQEDERIIDGVVFCVEAGVINNPMLLVNMKSYYDLVKEMGNPVFFAVTKVDLLFKNMLNINLLIEKNPQFALTTIVRHEKWAALQRFVQKNIGDNDATVLPVINYTAHDISTNPVVKKISGEFVKKVTQKMEQHFAAQEAPTPTTTYGGSFDPFLIRRPSTKPGEKFLFRGEDHVDLNYKSTTHPVSPIRVPRVGPTENFVIYDMYYKLLNLQRSFWRLFYCFSRTKETSKMVGMYNPDENAFFEHIGEEVEKKNLTKSFGDRRVQSYCYLDKDGRDPHAQFLSHRTEYIRITLAGNPNHLLLRREPMTKYHAFVVRAIQERKETVEMENRLRKRMDDLKKKHDQDVKELQSEILILHRTIQVLNSKVFPQQHPPQPQPQPQQNPYMQSSQPPRQSTGPYMGQSVNQMGSRPIMGQGRSPYQSQSPGFQNSQSGYGQQSSPQDQRSMNDGGGGGGGLMQIGFEKS